MLEPPSSDLEAAASREKPFSRLAAGLVALALGALAWLVLWPAAPVEGWVPSRDAGVFLTIGERMGHGAVPYRDLWDHKPPLIYLINGLGLWLGGGSAWGVWALEWCSLWLALGLGFWLLRATWGWPSAIAATAVWGSSLALVLEQGNFTEEYALPFQFGALAAFWLSRRSPAAPWAPLAVGVAAMGAFLLKPTLVGLPLAIGCFWLLERAWRPIGLALAGACGVAGSVAAWLALNGALAPALDQVVHYNAVYGQAPLAAKLFAPLMGLALYQDAIKLAAVAWGLALGALVWGWRRRDAQPLVAIAAIALPLEVVFAALPGRYYGHYYIAWLPVMALLLGWLASRALHWLPIRWRSGLVRAGVISLLVVVGGRHAAEGVLRPYHVPAAERSDVQRATLQAADMLRRTTDPSDHTLIWGAEAGIYFLAGRPPSTRFIYQYPSFTPGYGDATTAQALLDDLRARPPRLIVDTSATNAIIAPLDRARREAWAAGYTRHPLFGATDMRAYRPSAAMEPIYAHIERHYRLAGSVGPWDCYEKR